MHPRPYLITIIVPGRVDSIIFNRDTDINLVSLFCFACDLRQAKCACDIPRSCDFPPVRPGFHIVDLIVDTFVFDIDNAPFDTSLIEDYCENCANTNSITKIQLYLTEDLVEGYDHYYTHLLVHSDITTFFLHGNSIPGNDVRIRHQYPDTVYPDEVPWAEYINPDTDHHASPAA